MQDFSLAAAKYSAIVAERFVDNKIPAVLKSNSRIPQDVREALVNAEALIRDLLPHVQAYTELRDMQNLIETDKQ